MVLPVANGAPGYKKIREGSTLVDGDGNAAPGFWKAEHSESAYSAQVAMRHIRARHGAPWAIHCSTFHPHPPWLAANRSRADTTTRAAVVPHASPPTLQTIERLRRSRSQSTVDCASTLVLLLFLGASCWLGPAANGCASRISLTGAHTTPEQPHLALRRSFFLTSLRRPSHLDGVLGVAPP
jgi:hypothetical protein